MTFRQTLIIVTTIRMGCADQLANLLNARGDAMQAGATDIPLDRIQTIHIARWVIVDGIPAKQVPSRLIFCSNYDGPVDEQLADLVRLAMPFLDECYQWCDGYPAPADRTADARRTYLQSHIVAADAIFIGNPDRTLTQIRQEDELRRALQEYLNGYDARGKSPRQVRQALRDFVFAEERLRWARTPPPPRESTWMQVGLLIIAAPLLLPFALLWLLALRLFCERTDVPLNLKPCELDPKLMQELERREDIATQSPFSQLMEIKPGRVRHLTLRGVLWLSNFVGRYLFKNGNIMFIPSIHFYTWIILPEGRLLFFSNFDGSWQNYLGDFIDKAAFGLNGVLSNCVGFPKTWFLFFKGVKDVEHYKAWARWANIPTQVWYIAYPRLTVKNINKSSAIRAGLLEDMDDMAAAKWLRKL